MKTTDDTGWRLYCLKQQAKDLKAFNKARDRSNDSGCPENTARLNDALEKVRRGLDENNENKACNPVVNVGL